MGVANALAIATEPGVKYLALGGIDLQKDLGAAGGGAPLPYVRSHLVVAARAAGLEPAIDSVYPYLQDTEGLRQQAHLSRSFGFFSKSAIHPSQLPIHRKYCSRTDSQARDDVAKAEGERVFELRVGA